MSAALPERWDDEPWPLDEPDTGAFRVTNRSDTYDDVPQVADLADEAWEYAVDHGVSMERALVEVQGQQFRSQRFHTGGFAPSPSAWGAVGVYTPTHMAFVDADGSHRDLSDRVVRYTLNAWDDA